MGFTVGQVGAGLHLIAVCDGCGEVMAAERDGAGDCVLPMGWVRLAREDIGTLYTVPIVRSILACPDCMEKIAEQMNSGMWRNLPGYAEDANEDFAQAVPTSKQIEELDRKVAQLDAIGRQLDALEVGTKEA